MLFELLTGRRAFDAATASDAMAAVLTRDPDWSSLPAETPSEVTSLLERCLEKDVRRRQRDAGDARLELERVQARTSHRTTERRPDGATSASRSTATPAPNRRVVFTLTAFAMLAMGLAAWGWLRPVPPSQAPKRTGVSFEIQMPSGLRHIGTPAMSPAGDAIAFVAGKETGELYLRRLSDATPQLLAGTRGASRPFWSPDGQQLAYFADGKLVARSVSGTAAIVLADAPGPRGGAWGDDGRIVFAPGVTTPLSQVAATGGASRVVTTLKPGEQSHRWPIVLPRAAGVIFTIVRHDGGWSLALLRPGSTSHETLIDGASAARYLDGRLFYVTTQGELASVPFDVGALAVTGPVSLQPERAIVGFNLSDFAYDIAPDGTLAFVPEILPERRLDVVERDGTRRSIPGPPRAFDVMAMSPDGRTLAITVGRIANWGDIWLTDLDGNIRQLTRNGMSRTPVWHPDGRQIFVESRSPAAGIYVVPAEGAGDARAVLSGDVAPIASLQGNALVAYRYNIAGSSDQVLLVRPESTPTVVSLSARLAYPRPSPDGRWVAYASNDSGQWEVFLTTFPTPGRIWPISQAGSGREPRWSPASDAVYFLRQDGEVMVVPVGRDGPNSGPRPVGVGRFEANVSGPGRPLWDTLPGGRFVTAVTLKDPRDAIVVTLDRFAQRRGGD